MTKITKSDLLNFGENTRLVLGGRDPAAQHGFVNPPVYKGSTVLFPTVHDLDARTQRYEYGRRGTPTSDAFAEAMIAIEGGAGVALCPSGLAAATTALLSCLAAGDHVLVPDSVYGPVRHACSGLLARLGIETTFYDPLVGGDIAALMQPNTKAVYVESPGSQTFEIQDLPAIAAAAHARGATVLVDNTWATPLFFDAFGHGADLVLHAGTKYVIGHSDAMFGIVSANAGAWPKLKAVHGDMGLCAGPEDIYLALRGLRTMGVRLRQHQDSALQVARWLRAHPQVQRVLHPALEGDPGHALWQRDFTGASGLFSFVLADGTDEAVAAFLDGLKLFGLGYSWGGFESLAVPFKARRTATAWTPGGPCVRLHIGLEDVADLLSDLEEGLERYRRAS